MTGKLRGGKERVIGFGYGPAYRYAGRVAALALFLALFLALSWPAAVFSEETAETGSPSAEELIVRPPSVDDYDGFTRCIDMKRIRNTRVLDERHLVVEMRQKAYYVIQLPQRCPGLRRNRPVMTEPRGRQFCQFDSIRAMHDNGFGGLEPGIRCTVPGFLKVTKEQVVQLRESLELERKRAKVARREARKAERR